ncbi:Putative fatty acyl-CoA reductase CG5065 [Gryllus bimaculatus]|nr:Putative fatty acyl-CoA reductase CG5065 [Gryllus bimaculatus]
MDAAGSDEGVAAFFRGKEVLITGATGFLGKCIVERLLRSCPEVGTIHLLLRPKKGQDALARRVVAVRGDVTMHELGLSAGERQRLGEGVRVLLHCAANVRFDMPLRTALSCNLQGTQRVLRLAEQLPHLQAFVHVSTAYCHCDRPEVLEKLYPPRADPEKTLRLLDWMSDDMLEALAPKFLGDLPNTYALSKNLTEGLIAKYAGKFPIGIARPSIVTSVWKEPLPGWVDNINGPTGLLMGAGKGVIRSMLCKGNYHADVVPVDMAANAVLMLAWRLGKERPSEIDVVNLTTWKDNLVTWTEVIEKGRRHLYANPLSGAIWYPDGSIKSSWLVHTLCVIFFHFLPAYLIDLLLLVCGHKPFMVRVQKRIQGGLEALQYYTLKEWHFPNTRMHELHKQIPPNEQDIFYWGVELVDLDKYTLDTVLGTRHYYLKDKPETLPKARRHLRMLYVLDRFVALLFYGCLLWFIWTWSQPVLSGLETMMGAAVMRVAPSLYVSAEDDSAFQTDT